MNLNLFIFNLIHNLSSHSICLDSIGIFLAQYLILFFPALIFLAWFFKRRENDFLKLIILVFGSISFSEIINLTIRSFYSHPRPFVTLNFIPLINILSTESSFPSGHTSLAFVFALIVYSLDKKIGIVALILALLVGIGRIFVGVHWPIDILGGIIVGWLGFFMAKEISNKLLIN